jgi:aspartate-semialdehyde dehydrogenase
VLGATGAVGQRFISLLWDHPQFELEVLAASAQSSVERYKEAVGWKLSKDVLERIGDRIVEAMDFEILKSHDVKVVFSALPSAIARDMEENLAEEGYFVFSNASTHRMDDFVPLLIADVNSDHISLVRSQPQSPGFIVTNPNCTVSGLATALAPLYKKYGFKNVCVTTFQALSGAGYPGVPSLDIIENVLPHIPGEEEKVESECQKILGDITPKGIDYADFDVIASCACVPVSHGHLESVLVELKDDASLEDIKRTFSDFNGSTSEKLPSAPQNPIIVCEEEDRPQPRLDLNSGEPERARGMSVSVGRFKKKNSKLRFFLLVHNTIRGAAGCSILNAEFAKVKGFI